MRLPRPAAISMAVFTGFPLIMPVHAPQGHDGACPPGCWQQTMPRRGRATGGQGPAPTSSTSGAEKRGNAACHRASREIGRASCRERVCQYGYISVVAVSLKKNNIKTKRVLNITTIKDTHKHQLDNHVDRINPALF